ncbi:MAG TPA: PQQ-dependent sugar dehydrogenase [Longimicrobiales bacterium]|nr:PQQ-dependent sugar dehydrogenase [Longimicrobiales bacterium]
MRKSSSLVLAAAAVLCACNDDVVDPDRDDPRPGVELVAEGLSAPVTLMEAPDGTRRLFVVDQAGLIRIVTADGTLLEEPFLDVRDRLVVLNPAFDERGLLGLAFHPQYASNGRFFVYYSAPLRAGAPADFDHTSHLSEFTVSADPNVASPGSERILLQVDQPQFNHDGGTVAFGPDGYLYLSLGDGGGGDDVGIGHVEDWYDVNGGGNGQDLTANLLGSILRLDVDTGDPYGIPADNPFVGAEGLDEIWAYGFRNPYRFSFDMGGTNQLFVGDAGQELYEEVSIVTRGGNYGWNVKEGTHCFSTADPDTPLATCPSTGPDGEPLIDPVIEFQNSKQGSGLGLVVVGGHVYRGDAVSALSGRYIFGAWSTSFSLPDGHVLAATPQAGPGLWPFEELLFANTPTGKLHHFVLGFGQDLDGEVYVLTSDSPAPTGSTGKVYRIIEVN